MGLSFTIAVLVSAVILGSESRWSHDHILLFLSFETPPTWRERPLCLYPAGTGWPSYTPRHWVSFRRLLRLTGLRWRYLNSTPCWLCWWGIQTFEFNGHSAISDTTSPAINSSKLRIYCIVILKTLQLMNFHSDNWCVSRQDKKCQQWLWTEENLEEVITLLEHSAHAHC
jgi:hypothetical protein